jgi:hypothetical protein
MTPIHKIDIARDFSRFPGGRSVNDGPHSGEEFLSKLLVPAVQEAKRSGGQVVIVVDDVAGLPASFLDEAFGGLIRRKILTSEEADRIIVVEAKSMRVKVYENIIRNYLKNH